MFFSICIGTVVSCLICWDEREVWMETRKRAELMLTRIRGSGTEDGRKERLNENGWIGWAGRSHVLCYYIGTTESASLIGNRKSHVAAGVRDVGNVQYHNLMASSAHYYRVQTSS